MSFKPRSPKSHRKVLRHLNVTSSIDIAEELAGRECELLAEPTTAVLSDMRAQPDTSEAEVRELVSEQRQATAHFTIQEDGASEIEIEHADGTRGPMPKGKKVGDLLSPEVKQRFVDALANLLFEDLLNHPDLPSDHD